MAKVSRTSTVPQNEMDSSFLPYPMGPKYAYEGYVGLPYQELYLWFGVDTLYLATWTLRDVLVCEPKQCQASQKLQAIRNRMLVVDTCDAHSI